MAASNSLRRNQIHAAHAELMSMGGGLMSLMVGDFNYPFFTKNLTAQMKDAGYEYVVIDDCWAIVEAAEKYRKHCVMMENCNYDRMEMMVFNMVKKGLFGEILHAALGADGDALARLDARQRNRPRQAHLLRRDAEEQGADQPSGDQGRRLAASRASAVMRGQSRASSASAGVSHDPPQTGTLGRARNSGADFKLMPPVSNVMPLPTSATTPRG